jgi:hypothetical protein
MIGIGGAKACGPLMAMTVIEPTVEHTRTSTSTYLCRIAGGYVNGYLTAMQRLRDGCSTETCNTRRK